MTPDASGLPALPGRYSFRREVGRGGMGRVLLVRDSYLRRDVALKVLHEAPDPEDLEQVEREFHLLARVEHSGVARAHDFGLMEGLPYFTREYVRGKPLGQQVTAAALLDTARKLVEAVAYLHRSGVLHLDIKPGNVIVRALRRKRTPVLIDFGLCRRGLTAAAGRKVRGSLPYMGPECFRGGVLGPWTDVYAIGVTLYEAATGRLPREPPGSLESRRDLEPGWAPVPPPLSMRGAASYEALEQILFRCLALDPAARFPTAGDLLAELERVPRQRTARLSASPQAILSTVGREAELAAIDRFLSGVEQQNAGTETGTNREAVLFMTGPPGMGHTHLLRELWSRASTRGLRAYLDTGLEGRSTAPGDVLRSLGAHLEPSARRRWKAFLSRLRRPRTPSHDAGSESDLRARRAGEVAHAAHSLADPCLLVVDGLHLFDEISVDLIVHLAQALAGDREPGAPAAALALSYREEGPALLYLRELTHLLLQPGRSIVLPLAPLGPLEAEELHRKVLSRRFPETTQEKKDLEIYQRTSGIPARIIELAAEGSLALESAHPTVLPGPAWTSLEPLERRALLAMKLMARPTRAARLARLAAVSRSRASALLERLAKARLLRREAEGYIAEPGLSLPAESHPAAARMHAAIARDLLDETRGAEGAGLEEALHHAVKAGASALFRKHALRLARYLKSTNQNRAALEVLRDLVRELPLARLRSRAEAALELADLQARVGEIEEGIETLGALLGRKEKLERFWRVRLLLRLAMLHSRKGDFRTAGVLFEEGLRDAGTPLARMRKEELLFYRIEHAAMKAFVGDHEAASRICEEGLRLVGRRRDARSRELLLNLHAARAQIALRRFHFAEAASGFELALALAEASGALVNKAVVLNNLGIVYSQCDRCREAIGAFEAAERLSLRLDEGPSLTFVYGNLAILHSKLGDFEAADRRLGQAAKLSTSRTRSDAAARPISEWSRREELFQQHHRGVSLLHRGRHTQALISLESAIELGRAMGDGFVTAFDEVYRAEALLFQGSYDEAARALRRIARSARLPRLRPMAASRLAYLLALAGEEGDSARAVDEHAAMERGRPVPFLDAWDDLYLGWASSIAGLGDRGARKLAMVEDYFRRSGMRPGASLASWVRAESRLLTGDADGAAAILEDVEPGSDLVAVLAPLLEARLLFQKTPARDAVERVSDALARAGAALAHQSLPEWSERLESLRLCLAPADSRDMRGASRRSGHWKIWTEGFDRALWRAAARGSRPHGAAVGQAPLSPATAILRRGSGDASGGWIVARSEAMRRVLEAVDRIRESDLPLVITGETGTGKELLARLVHRESPRGSGPFRVLDCATLPPALADVELFGARDGSFTDLQGDRPGILESASGGTLLVEGLEDSPEELQAKFLRVLSEGTYRSVGESFESRADVRFIVSAKRDLEEESRSGKLRRDLFHRLQVLSIEVPPLRARQEDMQGLIDLFLEEGDGQRPSLEKGVVEALCARDWPGNVRELRNLVARLRFEHPRFVPLAAVSAAPSRARLGISQDVLQGETLDQVREKAEREYILHHFHRLRGDVSALGNLLGLSAKYCYRRLKELGIDIREERRGL